MTLEEARHRLLVAGLAAEIGKGDRPYIIGGQASWDDQGIKVFTFPQFEIHPCGNRHTEPDHYKAGTTILAQRGDWEYGDLPHCCEWVINRVALGPAMRELAHKAAEACRQREAELAAMSPDDRERAIKKWAEDLAAECSELND